MKKINRFWPNAAHARRWPTVGSPRARWHSCKNALALSDNSANTTRIISIDNDFTTEPSYLFTFAPERSPRRPALAGAADGGTRWYAGHSRLAPTQLTSRTPSMTLTPTLSGDTEQQGALERAATARGRQRRRRGHPSELQR